jgi:excinuclease ABC subunit A
VSRSDHQLLNAEHNLPIQLSASTIVYAALCVQTATELQWGQRGGTLYVLDEPTTGLHPTDVDRLMLQLNGLVDAGNSVVMVEHDMRVVAAADYVIDVGPGAGNLGGTVVAAGRPEVVAEVQASRTAPYLRDELDAYEGKGPLPQHP